MGEMRNQNIGHGHVYRRPDGMLARCGGPTICAQCARDLAQLTSWKKSVHRPVTADVDKTTDEDKPQ